MKRFLYLFIIIGAIILVVLIGYFLRYRAVSPSPSPTPTPGSLPNTGTQSNPPPSPSGQTPSPSPSQNPVPSYTGQKFGVVAQNPAVNYYVDPQGNAVLVQPDGQVVKVSSGNANIISSSAITNLLSANFSYDGTKILATFGDPSNPQASLFDVASKSWQPQPQGMISASWSPANYQVAYLAARGGSVAITTLDLSNAKAKPVSLQTLHAQDLTLQWVSVGQMILSDKGGALVDGSIWSFDTQKKTLQQLTDKFGIDSAWSGSAGMGLVFGAGQGHRGGRLSIMDTSGNALTDLKYLTMPEKCAFDTVAQIATSSPQTNSGTSTKSVASSKTKTAPAALPPLKFLYCGIPRDSQKIGASQLPDDYQTGALYTADDFSETDLSTGNITSIFADQGQTLDGTDLKLFNQTLFFINRFDQKLYAISLK